jgi:CheY-like chemotaxis protein
MIKVNRIKILWVDDNELGRDLAPRRLTRRGFNIIRVLDGQTAVEMAYSELPDLIVMDMSLPIKAGDVAIFEIKNEEKTRDIPIIALTAHGITEDKEKALKAGADDIQNKPIVFFTLLSKISRLLSINLS